MWNYIRSKGKQAIIMACKSDLGNGTSGWWGSFPFNGLILIHLPLSFHSIGSSSVVENHGPLHTNDSVVGGRVNVTRWASGFPIPWCCQPVWPSTSGFSLLSRNKEKTLLGVSTASLSREFCFQNKQFSIIEGIGFSPETWLDVKLMEIILISS